jgi:integral membrane protein
VTRPLGPSWGPRRLHRLLARAEVVSWTLLLLGMVLKYGTGTTELGVRVGGGVHGFVFLAYALVTVLVGIDARWSPGRLLAGLGSAVAPYLSVVFEHSAERAGALPEHWRLRSEPGRGPVERLVGTALRAPLPAALVALVALALVFTGLLAAGPPTEWVG